MCGGCGGRDADAGDARPGEAATLGTSPLPARGWGGCSQEYQEWLHTTQPPPAIPTHNTTLHTPHLQPLHNHIYFTRYFLPCTFISNVKILNEFKMLRYYLCSFNNRYLKSVCNLVVKNKINILLKMKESLVCVCKCSGWVAAGCAVD